MKTLFTELERLQVPHAVVFSDSYLRGTKIPYGEMDKVIVISIAHAKFLPNKFVQHEGRPKFVLVHQMSEKEKKEFREIHERYFVFKRTDCGFIFEHKKLSFKKWYDNHYFELLNFGLKKKKEEMDTREMVKEISSRIDRSLKSKGINASFESLLDTGT